MHEKEITMAKKVESGSTPDATSPGDICEEVRQAYPLAPGALQVRVVTHHRELSVDVRRWLHARIRDMYRAWCEERQQILIETWTAEYGEHLAQILLWLWRLGLV